LSEDEARSMNGGAAGGKRPNRPPPWEREATPGETASFGSWLRRQREMRDISLRDIAERTKISLRYLEAMEVDRFDILPAPIFAKGFLREYARYVGLSPDEVVNHYLAVHQPQELEEDGEETLARRRTKPVDPGRPRVRPGWTSGLVLALLGLILLALVALAVFYADRRSSNDTATAAEQAHSVPSIAAPSGTARAEIPPPPPEEPKAPLEVTLDFTGDCWVEAVIDGGATRFSELRVQGESLQLEAEESLLLTLGNAGAVEVQVNGQPFELRGGPGDVVTGLRIDLETARSLRGKNEAR
jgi:cytoskeleton protein RodZ